MKHDVYEFNLGSEATIFYNQCQNIIRDPRQNKKTGIVAITGYTVTCPDWMPLMPMKHKLVSHTTKDI